MNRRLLRWLNPFFLILGFSIILAIQSSLSLSLIQTPLLFVFWFGFRRSFEEGGVLSLCIAHILELQSACPKALFSLSILGFFLIARGCNRVFLIQNLKNYCFTFFILTLFFKIERIIYSTFIFSLPFPLLSEWLPLAIQETVITSTVTLIAFPLLEKLDLHTFSYDSLGEQGKKIELFYPESLWRS